MSTGVGWTSRDEKRLAKYYRQGMYWDEIAELLERTEVAVKSRASLLKLIPDRKWTKRQIAWAKRMRAKKRTGKQIADAMGKSESSVHQLFHRLGLCKPHIVRGPERDKFIREKHALQWSDSEISEAWTRANPNDPASRKWITSLRQRMGLAANGNCERRRRKVAEKTAQQLKRAGLRSLAELRSKAWQDYATRQGWPQIRHLRLVQILNLLYEHGPQTRETITKAIGMTWAASANHPATRRALKLNNGNSAMGYLMQLGLVIRLGRSVKTGRGKGKSVFLYSIAPHVRRNVG